MSNKLREALAEIRLLLVRVPLSIKPDIACGIIAAKAKSALHTPPRNCDVGTAYEQFTRWEKLCESYGGQCFKCKFYTSCDLSAKCFAKWSQMPYEEGGNNADK